MGARIYLPTLGRFAQVDPIEGGTENNYVYPTDPVNMQDLSGECIGPLAAICAAVVYTAARAAVSYATGKIVVAQATKQSAKVIVSQGGKATARATAIRVQSSRPNPLVNVTYSPKVQGQMRVDKHHGFPKIIDNYGAYGKVQNIVGGDGIQRQRLTIQGSLNGKEGYFEYIIEPNGVVNHRLFQGGK